MKLDGFKMSKSSITSFVNSLLLKLVGITLNKGRAAVTNSLVVLALTKFCMASTAVSSSTKSLCKEMY